MNTSPSSNHTSSQGHALSTVAWLDAHFEAERPEYEALLRSVGLRRGWHVLDAGCGAGSFLPLIASEVGPTGRITALDLAPENIVALEHRAASWALECPLATVVGSLLAIPLPDGILDALWCANTSQYLSDHDLRSALAEFRRVVRPGGLVALKEGNAIYWNFAPGGPCRMWRALEATRGLDPQVHGLLRTPDLRRWLEEAGYDEVWQRTVLCERWAPLRESERQYHGEVLRWLGQLAARADLTEEDHIFWRNMQEIDAPEHPLNQANFSASDGQTVIVGRVP